jgi:hypothetical protein
MSNGQYSLINTRGMASARAMRAFKREKEIERLRLKRKPAPPKPQPDFVNTEMMIPGESREYKLTCLRCHTCDSRGSILETKYPRGQNRAYYRVRCALESQCKASTPWLQSSKAAIQLWKVTAALVK